MIDSIHGVVVIDKPVGPTSFAIVREARRMTGARKVGHGGTLDPLASGVLPVCFGEATKLAQFLLEADKEYEATIRFGVETDTYDAGGNVTLRLPTDHLGEGDVRRALAGFMGDQQQLPPMYSALKREGRPLYDYARAGQSVDRVPRTVHFHVLELRGFVRNAAIPATSGDASSREPSEAPILGPEARIFTRCSKGTYVRSLAHDLGRALGTAAHLAALRRTRSGPFGIEHAVGPDALARAPLPLILPADALRHLASVVVSRNVARILAQGKPVPWADAPSPPPGVDGVGHPIRILEPGGQLVAVARPGVVGEPIHTIRVFRGDWIGD
jgi:tRNA pseudouridine55 synthase